MKLKEGRLGLIHFIIKFRRYYWQNDGKVLKGEN